MSTIQKGIYIFARHYVNNGNLTDYHLSGADRVATIEQAIGQVPEVCRAELRKQLGCALEAPDGFKIISATAFDKATRTAAFISIRSIDLVIA